MNDLHTCGNGRIVDHVYSWSPIIFTIHIWSRQQQMQQMYIFFIKPFFNLTYGKDRFQEFGSPYLILEVTS